MGWEERYRGYLLVASAHRLTTITTVLRGEYQLLLIAIEIAGRPSVVATGLKLDDLLCR
jgi:hypothetical protein